MSDLPLIVIPARLHSTRLPDKVLADIAGRPMIQRVWEAAQAARAGRVLIATDHERIAAVARAFGAECIMTRDDHASGSDRIAEVADQLGLADEQMIVNLQGDEPEMPAACLDQVARLLDENADADVSTLFWPIEEASELIDPSAVKLVTDDRGRALYFSRAAIPHVRGAKDAPAALGSGQAFKRHLGLYAYRVSALRAFTAAEPATLELSEGLEQLRFLAMGRSIVVARAAEAIPPGIDTPEDLARVRESFSRKYS